MVVRVLLLLIESKKKRFLFMALLAKKRQANISATELEALQILAADLLGCDSVTLEKLVEQKKLIEVNNDE